NVAAEVAELPGTKVLPCTPIEGVIEILFIRSFRCDPEPKIPMDRLRDRVGAVGPILDESPRHPSALPGMNFTDFADRSFSDQGHGPPVDVMGLNLVAHLRHDAISGCGV